MNGVNEHPPDDAELTAFLDGELTEPRQSEIQRWADSDRGVRERLALIEHGDRPFRAAYDLVLEDAPHERLAAMLASISAPTLAPAKSQRPRAIAALAAALAIFVLGSILGHFVAPHTAATSSPAAQAENAQPENWRQTVAEYFALQTADTFAAVPDDAQAQTHELEAAAAKLGLALSPQRLAFADLTLKRAELFKLRGMPLTEILYLDSTGGPVALCIIANGNPDATFRTEQREGLNIVYWQSQGRGFLLIGKTPTHELWRRAETVVQRLSS